MDPERYLADLEPVGWKLGLDRMTALCTELGDPEREFRALHVVGTNGKSSVALMTAALLEAAGVATGTCVSPHIYRWRERTRVGGIELGREPFEEAVREVAAAVGAVEAGGGERVTQFEAAIAASLVAFRNSGIEIAVIEAGLGGRLDATNVVSSSATALTSVALDHTDWLGDTVLEIAAEKLAVLEPGTELIVGRLQAPVARLAARWAARMGARYVVAPPAPAEAVPERFAPYLRRNAAVAIELAATVAPRAAPELSARVLGSLRLGGRVETIAGTPPLIADAAHNEEGAQALAEAISEIGTPRPRVGCVSLLADKDAAAVAAALAPVLDRVVCTAAEPGPAMGRPGAGALPAARLAEAFAAAGAECEVVDDPAMALGRAREEALQLGGVAICAGSNYLLRYVWTGKRDQSCSR